MADAPRKRRWPRYLAVVLALLIVGGIWVNRQLEPVRLTATVLARAGTALGLELSIEGTPEYALRPEPRLLLPKLTVRQPGAATPLLTAGTAEVSLPWDTLLGGESLVITRIGLDGPTLDLEALAAWQATRPPSPFELPTLTDGLRVQNGRVLGEGWQLDDLALQLPELRTGAPVHATASGKFTDAETGVDFDSTVHLLTAGLASRFEMAGKGRLRRDDIDVPWDLSSVGDFQAGDDVLNLEIAQLVLKSESPLPDMDASGTLRIAAIATAKLEGTIKDWPKDWPTLPPPLSASTSPLAYTLAYEGAKDFSAPIAVGLVRDDTRIDARFVLNEVNAWIETTGAPSLPPLTGTLSVPSLEVAGATLQGVTLQIDEDAPEEAVEPKP